MIVRFSDFNEAERYFCDCGLGTWKKLHSILGRMPIHLKWSQQARIHGRLIFDPVATNQYIKCRLSSVRWGCGARVPRDYDFFGRDIDFVHKGTLIEAQFSSYAFLANNLLRSEVFFRSKCIVTEKRCLALILVTKEQRIPASQSTLNFEQAGRQITALIDTSLLTIPIRLVGLSTRLGRNKAIFNRYAGRTSRTSLERRDIEVRMTSGKKKILRITEEYNGIE